MRNSHRSLLTGLLAVALVTPGVAGAADDTAKTQGKAGVQAEGKAAGAPSEKSPSQPRTQDPPASPEPSSEQAEPASPAVQGSVAAQAEADAGARLAARKSLEEIKQRGARVSSEKRAKAEAKLEAVATRTNEEVAAHGASKVAGRLAAEFGMSADQLMAERIALDCSWGGLMIAHSLQANITAGVTGVTVAQLIELHKEGTGWGQIAAGLGLKLGHVVSAVVAEGRVAAGLDKPDGKVAVIRGDGTRANVGAGAQTGARAAVPVGGASAATQAGVGVGVKVRP